MYLKKIATSSVSTDFFSQQPSTTVDNSNQFQGCYPAPGPNDPKPFYGYQDPTNFSTSTTEETTIIDLDNSRNEPLENRQPKGRLRIINQPDGPMTENIHDFKSSQAGQSENFMTGASWLPGNNSNNLLVFDQG